MPLLISGEANILEENGMMMEKCLKRKNKWLVEKFKNVETDEYISGAELEFCGEKIYSNLFGTISGSPPVINTLFIIHFPIPIEAILNFDLLIILICWLESTLFASKNKKFFFFGLHLEKLILL